MIEHLTRLARIVHAVRLGRTVTSGPHEENDRGRRKVSQEWFFKGLWPVSREIELMHRCRLTIGQSIGDTSDATDWSPQDMMQSSASWNEEALAELPPLPARNVDRCVDMIMALADGDWHMMVGNRVRMVPDTSPRADEICPWTFEEEGYRPDSMLKPLQNVLSQIIFHRQMVPSTDTTDNKAN